MQFLKRPQFDQKISFFPLEELNCFFDRSIFSAVFFYFTLLYRVAILLIHKIKYLARGGGIMSDCYDGGNYKNNGSQFVLIVVLFILLIIVGASFMKY